VILRLTVFVQLGVVTDGQTDGQTHDDRMYRANTASRAGKNKTGEKHLDTSRYAGSRCDDQWLEKDGGRERAREHETTWYGGA